MRERYIKKEGCHPDNQSFQLTLKSNTMKNTMQNYCFFPYLQALWRGISAKACFYWHKSTFFNRWFNAGMSSETMITELNCNKIYYTFYYTFGVKTKCSNMLFIKNDVCGIFWIYWFLTLFVKNISVFVGRTGLEPVNVPVWYFVCCKVLLIITTLIYYTKSLNLLNILQIYIK